MSRYFDKLAKQVREDFDSIEAVEAQLKRTVLLLTGDREFPLKYREQATALIAMWSYVPTPEHIPTSGRVRSNNTRESALVEELRSLFQAVAGGSGGKPFKTRFGYLTANPENDLKRRDDYVVSNSEAFWEDQKGM